MEALLSSFCHVRMLKEMRNSNMVESPHPLTRTHLCCHCVSYSLVTVTKPSTETTEGKRGLLRLTVLKGMLDVPISAAGTAVPTGLGA